MVGHAVRVDADDEKNREDNYTDEIKARVLPEVRLRQYVCSSIMT